MMKEIEGENVVGEIEWRWNLKVLKMDPCWFIASVKGEVQ